MDGIVIKACIRKEVLSEDEKIKLDSWLSESHRNRKIYNQLKLAILYPDNQQVQDLKLAGWDQLREAIHLPSEDHAPKGGLVPWLKIAAIFIICLSAILITFMLQEDSMAPPEFAQVKMVENISLPGQKITTALPDGTVVKLNSGSKIIVPEYFEGETREVTLIGEAFFDVFRDESKPFIIQTRDLSIRVLGTTFNVNAYEDNISESVAVKSGKVSVTSSMGGVSVDLGQNEMVSLNEQGKLSKERIVDQDLIFGWTEKRLVFKEHSIEEVLKTVSKWFGLEVVIKGEFNNVRPYTANYNNPTIEEVFKSLSHLYQFNYEINGKEIIIK